MANGKYIHLLQTHYSPKNAAIFYDEIIYYHRQREPIVFNTKSLSLMFAVILAPAFLGLLPLTQEFKSNDEKQVIGVVQSYFESRYEAFSEQKLPDLGKFVDESASGSDFARAEGDKLDIALYNSDINHLKPIQYEFKLDFNDVVIDYVERTAIVTVIEGHNVIFELSAPQVSSMRNLKHQITLKKGKDGWKITTDIYDDYLWRFIRETKYTKNDLYRLIEPSKTSSETELASIPQTGLTFTQTTASTLPYNRNGAVAYAHQWAFARNSDYYNFDDLGGDCTNFVSQAIHEGGNGLMVFGGDHGTGTPGWYYLSVNDRATAWTDVGGLYGFITDESYYLKAGPQGYEATADSANKSDIIQFKWNGNDNIWDHSVIIVDSWYSGRMYHLVSAHSQDIDNYPLDSILYYQRRFIHITGIEGHAIYIPLVIKSSGTYTNQTNAYLAPMDKDTTVPVPPYPASNEGNNEKEQNTNFFPYPAP